MKSFTPEGLQWAWDATSITAATTCPRYYQYTILLGWTPDEPMAKDLRFGAHFATAVESYYKYVILEGDDHATALRRVVRQAMIHTWDHDTVDATDDTPTDSWRHFDDKSLVKVPDTGMPWESYDANKNRWNLIRTIIWYFCHYVEDKHDTTTIVTLPDGRPAVELSFSFEIADDITYCGHMDRLSKLYDDDVFAMDQKTTGSGLSPFFFAGFDRSIQMSGYNLAGQVIFGTPIRGVMIDAAQVQVGGTVFGRGYTYRTEDQLNEWMAETEYIVRRTQSFTEMGFFPRDTTACGYYKGCPFQEICGKSPSNRSRFIKGKFAKRKRWDPIERR